MNPFVPEPISRYKDHALVQRSLADFPECAEGVVFCFSALEAEEVVIDAQDIPSDHVLIVVEAGVQAALLIRSSTQELHIRALLAQNAQFQCIHLQSGDKPAHITQSSIVGEGALIRWQNLTLGSQVKHEIQSILEGAHAESSVDWAFYVCENDRHTLSARNVFNAAAGTGEITMKGVAEDTAHARCDGMIEIGEQGGGTQTYLTEDVLMLDSSAKIDAIPGLEIRTNDVKASHSATVSRVSEEDLFYFAARGIAEATARRMYIEGFLQSLFGAVAQQEWREQIEGAVRAKYAKTA